MYAYGYDDDMRDDLATQARAGSPFHSWTQNRYSYGTMDPNEAEDIRKQRLLEAQSNTADASYAFRNQLDDDTKQGALDRQARVNPTFDQRLNDTSSNAYQSVPEAPERQAMFGFGMGRNGKGRNAKATAEPAPPMGFALTRRELKPEYQPAFDAQRTKDSLDTGRGGRSGVTSFEQALANIPEEHRDTILQAFLNNGGQLGGARLNKPAADPAKQGMANIVGAAAKQQIELGDAPPNKVIEDAGTTMSMALGGKPRTAAASPDEMTLEVSPAQQYSPKPLPGTQAVKYQGATYYMTPAQIEELRRKRQGA